MSDSKNLNLEQLKALKKLIDEAQAARLPLSAVARAHPEYSYKSVKYWRTKFNEDPDCLKKLENELNKPALIEKLLLQAKKDKKSMSDIARENPEFTIHEIKYQNELLGILPIKKRKTYTIGEKVEILLYAAKHGIMNASRKFDVNNVTISEWNEKLQAFDTEKNPDVVPLEKRIKILNEVLMYNIINENWGGVAYVSEEYGLNHRTLYTWNKVLKIFIPKPQKERKPKIFPSEENTIVLQSEQFDTVSELSRKVARSKQTVKNILIKNGVYSNDGH